METTKKRPRLVTILLVVVIVIMMVQNYFLVRKNDQNVKRVNALMEEINRLTLMNPGDSIHAFTALDMDSLFVVIDPSAENKKKLFLVFTTWCGACLQNMPQWNELLKGVSQKHVQVIGICPDPLYKIKEYRSTVNLSFPVYSIANDSSVMKKYKMLSVPQTILIDSSGLVVKVWPGVLENDASEEIKKAI